MKQLIKYLILFTFGGLCYGMIEIIGRHYTHWTMVILGGVCFIALGSLNEILSWTVPLMLQGLIGAGIVTLLELITGLIVNCWLGWHVWDYSNVPFNLWGQICLPYSILWFFISLVAIIVDDVLRWKWFNEEKPHYKIFWR